MNFVLKTNVFCVHFLSYKYKYKYIYICIARDIPKRGGDNARNVPKNKGVLLSHFYKYN